MNLVWSLVVSVGASLVTFFITTVLYQAKKEKRQEKISVFKALMATRNMNDYEAIKALNSIDVVFCDSGKVLSAWHRYRKSLRIIGEPTSEQNNEIFESEKKLYEAMARELGYKNITWDIIDKPHCPVWLSDMQQGQLNQCRYFNSLMQQNQVEKKEVENK